MLQWDDLPSILILDSKNLFQNIPVHLFTLMHKKNQQQPHLKLGLFWIPKYPFLIKKKDFFILWTGHFQERQLVWKWEKNNPCFQIQHHRNLKYFVFRTICIPTESFLKASSCNEFWSAINQSCDIPFRHHARASYRGLLWIADVARMLMRHSTLDS